MSSKAFVLMASILVLTGLSFGPQLVRAAQASDCPANDRIDKSSADTAMKAFAKSGFVQIHDLKKGCDNFWHGQATKDGVAVNIVLSPSGEVKTEGD